jgi:ATP-dependent DNA ligase
MLNGDDMRRKPFAERKAAIGKLLFRSRDGIQYVELPRDMAIKCLPPSVTSVLRVSKRLDAPYRSGPSKSWIKVKNPDAPAATRAIDGTFLKSALTNNTPRLGVHPA